MICEHLTGLELELLRADIKELYRGQPWSKNCREWVYFDCCLDLAGLRARLDLAPSVIDHVHRGTHDGAEAGFVCTCSWDAVMGAHPDVAARPRRFG